MQDREVIASQYISMKHTLQIKKARVTPPHTSSSCILCISMLLSRAKCDHPLYYICLDMHTNSEQLFNNHGSYEKAPPQHHKLISFHYKLVCIRWLMYWILLVVGNYVYLLMAMFIIIVDLYYIAIPLMPTFDPEHMRIYYNIILMGHTLRT